MLTFKCLKCGAVLSRPEVPPNCPVCNEWGTLDRQKQEPQPLILNVDPSGKRVGEDDLLEQLFTSEQLLKIKGEHFRILQESLKAKPKRF